MSKLHHSFITFIKIILYLKLAPLGSNSLFLCCFVRFLVFSPFEYSRKSRETIHKIYHQIFEILEPPPPSLLCHHFWGRHQSRGSWGGFAKRLSYLISLLVKVMTKGGGGQIFQKIDAVFYEWPLCRILYADLINKITIHFI